MFFKSRKKNAETKVQFLDEMIDFVTIMNLDKCRHIGLACFLNQPEDYRLGCYVWGLGSSVRDGKFALRERFWKMLKADPAHERLLRDCNNIIAITQFQLTYKLDKQHFCIVLDLQPNRFNVIIQQRKNKPEAKKPWLQYEFASLGQFDPHELNQSKFNWREPKQIAEFFHQ